MSHEKWNITLRISRQKGSEARSYQGYSIEADPDEYVLDTVERVWAFMDRSLCFRHACHHSTCGACGMLVNGVEKLTCITLVRSVVHDGGTLVVEPLRNFPVISDLVVDMSSFYTRMDDVKAPQVAQLNSACLPFERKTHGGSANFERLVDCIECGLCISACPAALTSSEYLGPAVLAAAQHVSSDPILDQVDNQNGPWRCHSAFECTAVCPSNVNPGWRIMDLRKKIIRRRVKKLFHRNPQG
jgi:succinate dehydrogenase / fumarate reductase iron-sulfur subunit